MVPIRSYPFLHGQGRGLLRRRMNGLDIEKAHVVGLSMGGVMALEVARHQPERLRTLILSNTFAFHPDGKIILKGLHQDIERMSMRDFAKKRVPLILAPQTSEAIRQEVIEAMRKIDKRTYRWSTRAVWTADYRSDLPRIRIPTLIAIGEYDQLTASALSEELHRGISGSTFTIIPKASHLSNLDNPGFFNRMVEDFILSIKKGHFKGYVIKTCRTG